MGWSGRDKRPYVVLPDEGCIHGEVYVGLYSLVGYMDECECDRAGLPTPRAAPTHVMPSCYVCVSQSPLVWNPLEKQRRSLAALVPCPLGQS